jgi:hypothetical protein
MASTFPTSLDTFTNPTASSLLTSPSHSLSHSDLNDAVEALETKVAIGNTVLGKYTTVTPTFSTGITIGNGTATGAWCRVNDFVHYFGRLTFGSTTTIDTAGVQVGLPVNADSTYIAALASFTGSVGIRDASAPASYVGSAQGAVGFPAVMFLQVYTASGTYVANTSLTTTVPMTWAVSDLLWWDIIYKAA